MSKLNYLFVFMLMISVACSSGEMAETESSDDSWDTKEMRTQYEDIKVTKLVGDLERPWAVAFLPDGRKLVTEKPGRLNIVDGGEVTVVDGTPEVSSRGQGGLLDVSLHPDYDDNGWIYLSYSKPNDDGDTVLAVVRGRLDGSEFTDQEEIFEMNRYASPGRHYGSRFAWDSSGYLYVSVGDFGANPPRAQDLSDHAGSLLRMYDDGTVPADNPFVGDDDAAPEIFSYGHRNIQGLIINPENDEIWATEHGPRGGDELNMIEAGKNYGWPNASLGRAYGDETSFHDGTEARSIEGMEDPVYEFLPTLAPAGLALVTSDNFPNWKGNLLAGGLRAERIRRLLIMDYTVIHDEELLLQEVGRIRDVREGPDGNIYVLTDEDPGALYVIEPADL
ncbi:MAG: PQQ-dependent sugar dehydrogenase [Balneolaceae bacterium]|nr:PQQ-dependent sugar dehydrogenase [Balneolaceae bacterium]